MIDGSETEGMYGIQGQSVSIFSLKFTDYHHIQEESWMFGQELAPCAAEVEEPSIHLSIYPSSRPDILTTRPPIRPGPISLPLTRTLTPSALSCKSAHELASVQGLI